MIQNLELMVCFFFKSSAIFFIGSSCFTSGYFQDFLFIFGFQQSEYNMPLCDFLCIDHEWICHASLLWWLSSSRIRMQCGRSGFNSWVGKIPLERGKATHSSILAWRIPWTVQSMESKWIGHDWVIFTFFHFELIILGLSPILANISSNTFLYHSPIPLLLELPINIY